MRVKCAFWVNLSKLVFFVFNFDLNFVILKIIKQNWCKIVIFVIGNAIEMK